jgi:TRAP-type transport system small permease protein
MTISKLGAAKEPFSAEKIITRVSGFIAKIGVGFLFIMMLLTTVDVIMRYFFNKPIKGGTELTEVLMLFVMLMGLGWCALEGGHIKVDIVVSRFSPRIQAISNSLNAILVMGICIVLAWQAVTESISSWKLEHVTNVLRIPSYPFFWIIALSFSLFFFAMVIVLVKTLNKAANK